MRKKVTGILITLALVTCMLGRTSAQNLGTGPAPSCVMCLSELIPAEELVAYEQVAIDMGLTDQQVRNIDIGKVNVAVALARRGPLSAPGPRSVAEHDLVTEIYVVLSGSGTNVTGPELVDKQRRPPDYRAVQFLNGPGNNAAAIRNGITHELEPGDVFVIPAGTGHQFTKIDDHITYLMIRVDPDKVVPPMDAVASQAYLIENGQ